ncbi:MAG: O-antigen ligase family protein [bacterium]
MITLDKINRTIFFLILLTPVISIFFYEFSDIALIAIVRSAVIAYGIAFLFMKKNIQISRISTFILLFSVYIFIWSFFTGEFDNKGLVKTILYNEYLAAFFILVIIYNTKLNDKFLKNAISIIKILIVITAIGSVIQVFNSDFLQVPTNDDAESLISKSIYEMRRGSIYRFEGPNSLGLSFIPLLAVLIGYMLRKKDKNYIYFLMIGGLAALLTNTRYVMIGFIILSFQIIYYKKVKLLGFFRYAFIVLIFSFLAIEVLNLFGYNMTIWFEERLFQEQAITETTRYKAIGTFAQFFPEAPVFGTGGITQSIRSASRAVGSSHIHVGYLSHLIYYGIVGCFFLFGFWWLLLRRFYKNAKFTNYWGSFFAMLTFLFAFATMSESSFFFSGLIFMVIFDKYYIEKTKLAFYKHKLQTKTSS